MSNSVFSFPLSPKKVITLMGFVICVFAYLILKETPLPRVIVMGGAFSAVVTFWAFGLLQREMITYILVAYIPFSLKLPFGFGSIIPGLNLTNILIVTVTVMWIKEWNKAGPLWAKSSLNLPIYLFWALGIVSIVRGLGYGGGYVSHAFISYFRKWIVPFFLYFLFLNSIYDKRIFKNIVIIIMMVTVMIGLMSIYEAREVEGRVAGVFQQANILAAFFNYYMFLPFGFFLLNFKRIKFWAMLLPVLICLRAIMVTFSRSAYLAFVAGMYMIMIFRSKLSLVLLVLTTWFLFQNPAFIPEAIRYRIGQTFAKQPAEMQTVGTLNEESLDKSAGNRIRLWQAARWMIQENPIFGVGYNLFERKSLHYYSGATLEDPHNSYLFIAAEMGIPVILILLWILFQVFWNTHAVYKTTDDPFTKATTLGFLGGIFSLLVSNLYGSRFEYAELSSYFWILAGLIVRLRTLEGAEVNG